MLLAFAAYRDTLRGEARARCIERARAGAGRPHAAGREVSPALVAAVLTLVYADELDLALQVSQEGRSLAEDARRPRELRPRLGRHGSRAARHGSAAGGGGRRQRRPRRCPANQPVARAYAAGSLVKVLLKRGDLAAAETALAEAGVDSGHVPGSLHAADPLNALGSLHLAQGASGGGARRLPRHTGPRRARGVPQPRGRALALGGGARAAAPRPPRRGAAARERGAGAVPRVGRSDDGRAKPPRARARRGRAARTRAARGGRRRARRVTGGIRDAGDAGRARRGPEERQPASPRARAAA